MCVENLQVTEFSFCRYLRLKVPEVGGLIVESSDSRHRVLEELKPPKTKKEVVHLLSHQAEDNFTVFRDYKSNDAKAREPIATIAVGEYEREYYAAVYANV